MASSRRRSTSSRWGWRPASSRPLARVAPLAPLLAAALAGCGASAGAPCATDDDCAAGLTCRGSVCLPLAAGDADTVEPPDDADLDDGLPPDAEPDVEEDDGAGDAADADEATDDGADVPPPPLGIIAPGEVYDPPDPAASGVLGAAGEGYVLVLWDNGLGIFDHWDVEVLVENGRKSGEPRVVELDPPPGRAAIPCLPGRFVDPTAVRLPDAPWPILRDPLPGDTAVFKVINAAGTGMDEITARLQYLGPDLEFWLDETNPFAGPGADVYEAIAAEFQGTILPRERAFLHPEPDVDGNGRVTILISPTVGEIGAAGYVNPYDLTSSVYGNLKDMIYLNPPPDWMGREWQILNAAGVLAHELQHLIRAGALGIDPLESIYLNEGMSHLAADVAGYGFDNLWFLTEFLDDYEPFTVPRGIDSARMSASTDMHEDIVMRSAGYFLLRYLFDRLGGVSYGADGSVTDTGGLSLLRAQFTGDRFGIAALEWAAGASRRDFLPDWLTALLLDGRNGPDGTPLTLPPRHRFAEPTTDPRTGAPHGIALNADNAYLDFGSVWLGNVVPTDLGAFSGRLDAGGVALLSIRPAASGPVVVRLTREEGSDIGVRWVRVE